MADPKSMPVMTPGRVACVVAFVVALILPGSATADNLKCGPGTVKAKNVCLPDYTAICGAGTQLVNGQCVPAPKQPVCGDGILDIPEEACDDGNTVDETQCPYGTPTCHPCSSDCTHVLTLSGDFCGDGNLDDLEGEECDDGNTCTEACPYGQAQCEVCDRTCKLVMATGHFCGDGITSDAELCDDGNPTCGTCSADCRTSQPGGDCAAGEACSTGSDCVSGTCVAGMCVDAP